MAMVRSSFMLDETSCRASILAAGSFLGLDPVPLSATIPPHLAGPNKDGDLDHGKSKRNTPGSKEATQKGYQTTGGHSVRRRQDHERLLFMSAEVNGLAQYNLANYGSQHQQAGGAGIEESCADRKMPPHHQQPREQCQPAQDADADRLGGGPVEEPVEFGKLPPADQHAKPRPLGNSPGLCQGTQAGHQRHGSACCPPFEPSASMTPGAYFTFHARCV